MKRRLFDLASNELRADTEPDSCSLDSKVAPSPNPTA